MPVGTATDQTSAIEPSVPLSAQLPPAQHSRLVTSVLGGAQAVLGATVNVSNYILRSPARLTTEGALDGVATRLAKPNGPMDILRKKLNSCVQPKLRDCKSALEKYRSALEGNSTDLIPLLKALHTQLFSLLTQRNLVPEFIPDHWERLGTFVDEIQKLIDNPDNLPPHAQLLKESKEPLQTLAYGFEQQQGIAEEVADLLVGRILQGVDQGVSKVATLPRQMIQNFQAPQPPPLPAQPAAAASTTSVPGESSLNQDLLAEKAKKLVKSILSSTVNTASQNAASVLSTLVCSAFIKIREHIDQNPKLKHLLGTVNPMIERLQKTSKLGNWHELTTSLTDAFQFMQMQLVYLQGLRLPVNPVRTHSSALPGFLQNITRHQNALQIPEQRISPKITGIMIEQQQRQLRARLATYGPAKLIAEKFCRLDSNDAFYTEMFMISDSQDDLESVFRERLFRKIDQTSLKLITKWVAKGIFDLLLPISAFYTGSILDRFLSLTSGWIKNTPGFQHSKEELFIKLTRNWLAVTSAAYNSVANTPPSQTKDFSLMMEEAMKIPERNGGLTQNELFAAVAKTAIDTFGPRIKWDAIIDNYFNAEIPSTSPVHFLNPLVRGINSFCSFCLKAFVFIPQWIGNHVLQGGAKFILSSTSILANYTEQTIESLRRNTPTSYAMQCMLSRQMQKILAILQEGLNEDPDSKNYLPNRETNVNKVEITGLVEYIFEVLSKSQYQTQDRLHNYLQNHAPLRDKLGREIDDAALPDLMGTAVRTISIAMKALSEEEEMQQILFDCLCVANNAFDFTRVSVTDQEFAALETGNRELSDQVLETALFHAIGEKFDFTNKRQENGISNFISTLKDQTSSFTQQLKQHANEIPLAMPLDPAVLVAKISSMIELSTQYNRERVEALAEADGNLNFHTETKGHFNKRCAKLLEYCNPIAEHLNNMKIWADEMVKDEKIIHTLFSCNNIIYSLSEKTEAAQLSSDDFSFCKIQLSLLQSHLNYLRRNRNHAGLEGVITHLEKNSKDLSFALNRLQEIQKTESQLGFIGPLFRLLKQKKLDEIGTSPSSVPRELENEIYQIALEIPSNEQRKLLNQRVLKLMRAQTQESIESAAAQFSGDYIRISRENSIESNQLMQKLRQINALKPLLRQWLEEFADRFAKNKRQIESCKPDLIKNSKELQNLTQAENDLPIWNLFFVDMHWIPEIVKNLAFDRARSRIQQLFNSLYQKHFYVGFINQAAQLFLEKFGKHHLKK